MKKYLIVLGAMLVGSMCFAQSIGKANGNSKPIPRKPKTKTEVVRVYALTPKKLEKETVYEESESKYL